MNPAAGPFPPSRFRVPHGLSMAETLTVIAIIGVLAAIMIPNVSGILRPSKTTVASNLVETLNQAVHRFNQTNYELRVAAASGSGDDEMLALRTLQYRNPFNPKPGSPYMRHDWNPVTSSSTSDYRVAWSGTLYKLLAPGQSGTGLKVDFEGGDLGEPYVFPSGYSMAGQ